MTDALLYDIEAEKVVGVALLYPSAVQAMLSINVASDFGALTSRRFTRR